jgi:hypothetical protein
MSGVTARRSMAFVRQTWFHLSGSRLICLSLKTSSMNGFANQHQRGKPPFARRMRRRLLSWNNPARQLQAKLEMPMVLLLPMLKQARSSHHLPQWAKAQPSERCRQAPKRGGRKPRRLFRGLRYIWGDHVHLEEGPEGSY